MRTVSVSNAFFAEAERRLRMGDEVRLLVQGNSMLPFILGGRDEVTLAPYHDEDLPLGTAAFYQWNGKYMVHRLVKKEGDRYHFLGDGNIYRIESIPRKDVLGVLKTIHHPNGTSTDATAPRWLRMGLWWYRMRPFRRYILFAYKRMRGIPNEPA